MTTPGAAELFDLSGRVALITGGSRGLGRQIALAVARAGGAVIVASRRAEACEVVAEEIRGLGGRALPVACHVGRWDEVSRLAETAWAEFGRVDVLVNNAGMSPHYPSLGDVTEEMWDKVLGVNLKGPFRLSALIGERMVADGGGAIINMSSIAANRPTADEAPYAAAKAGLNNLTLSLARAFAPTVRVNSIVAGPFLTDMASSWKSEMFERHMRRLVLRRAGEPEEIVGAALFLASQASSYVTGAMINVHGGGF
jgi:NAD(P)-dependent dehydrogenase (short-subunit alcohol dehydrogenase family)